jgi:hypothetical protein
MNPWTESPRTQSWRLLSRSSNSLCRGIDDKDTAHAFSRLGEVRHVRKASWRDVLNLLEQRQTNETIFQTPLIILLLFSLSWKPMKKASLGKLLSRDGEATADSGILQAGSLESIHQALVNVTGRRGNVQPLMGGRMAIEPMEAPDHARSTLCCSQFPLCFLTSNLSSMASKIQVATSLFRKLSPTNWLRARHVAYILSVR